MTLRSQGSLRIMRGRREDSLKYWKETNKWNTGREGTPAWRSMGSTGRRKFRIKTLHIKLFSQLAGKIRKLGSFSTCCPVARRPRPTRQYRFKVTHSWNNNPRCRQCIRKGETITNLPTWRGPVLQTRLSLWLNPKVLVQVGYRWRRARTTRGKPCTKGCRKIWPSKVPKGEGATTAITTVPTTDRITDMLT